MSRLHARRVEGGGVTARLIRDGLIESEQVLALSLEARWLFLTILLTADDFGIFEATPFLLARRADLVPKGVERAMLQLIDGDLVRTYRANAKAYGFVPRFRQRVQVRRLRFPLPPDALVADDVDAMRKITEFRATHGAFPGTMLALAAPAEHSENLNRVGQSTVNHRESPCVTVNNGNSPPEAEAEAEAEEEKRPPLPSVGGALSSAKSPKTLPCPHDEVLKLWADVLPAMPQHLATQWKGTRADHLRARWRETAIEKAWKTEADGLDYFRKLFAYVGRSAFLTGKTGTRGDRRPFVVELAWLVNATNWAKVHEGKYHEES